MVRTQMPVAAQRRFQGKLLGLVDEEVQLDLDGSPIAIPFDLITRAHLVDET